LQDINPLIRKLKKVLLKGETFKFADPAMG